MNQRMLISAPFFPYDAIEEMAFQPDPGTYLSDLGADTIQLIEGHGGLGVAEVSFLEMMPELEGFSLDQVDPRALERARKACTGCQVIASTTIAACNAISSTTGRQQCIRTAEATRDACCATYNSMLASGGSAPTDTTPDKFEPPPAKTPPSSTRDESNGATSSSDNKTLLYVGGAIGLGVVGLLAVLALRK